MVIVGHVVALAGAGGTELFPSEAEGGGGETENPLDGAAT
jgi:hypothetical protein